jgi:hypothetical protein
MRTILASLAAVFFATLATSAAEIKSTTKLQISVAGADARSSEVTDPRVLALSNVYAGAFIGAPAEVANALTLYNISFDIQALDGVKTAAYVVQYGVDGAGQAYVYLPGRGEEPYRRNISTILRTGQDGHWHHASAEWSAAIQPYLP